MATKYSYSSSSGFLSGLPYSAGKAAELSGSGILSEVVDYVLMEGNKNLAEQMRASDLWEPFVGKVEIVWDGENFSYVLKGTPEENETMHKLEYGTIGIPASPMLRKHAFRLGDITSRGVEAVTQEVVGLGN